MRKFLVALILAGVMVFGGNQWAIAAHSEFVFVVPHEVAIVLDKWNFETIEVWKHSSPGCDDVYTGAIRDNGVKLGGYDIRAVDKESIERLVSVELYNMAGMKVFGWVNQDDYDALKACHTGTSV